MLRTVIFMLASAFGLGGLVLLITSIWLAGLAWPRDLDGSFANSPLHGWFDSLKSDKGLCCSFADGRMVDDPDIDMTGSKCGEAVCVKVDGEWVDVPKEAMVNVPNKFGRAVVWPYKDANNKTVIRCFLMGSGA